MLLEALVAILIFSLGILGVVGLQATAVQQSSDARYRSVAAQLAEQLAGEMWTGDRTITSMKTRYNTCATTACPGYDAWYQRVANALPGVNRSGTASEPLVTVDDAGVVVIAVRWRAPTDDSGAPARVYSTTLQIVPQ